MANNKVKFLRGTSNEYTVAEKDNDAIYFTTDDGKLYIGDKEISGDGSLTIDDVLSDTSKNPVQNKVIKTELDKKADIVDIPTSLPANGGNADTVNNHTVEANVPADAVFTDTIITEENVSNWGFTKNTGTYSKPLNGIPKTDLSTDIQASLSKADTALQTHQSLADYVKTTDSRLTDARTPIAHNQASNTINAMTGYSKPSSTSAITTSDSLNTAIGKLEKALDSKQTSGSYAASNHTHDDRYYTESEIDTKLNTKLNTSLKGAASGLAELDSSGKVPSAQLPSYVDDVLEYANQSSFPATGESGKIYIAQDTNKTYRWSGSTYIEISSSLALGETSSTAYRGDRGKIAYDHSQTAHAPSNAQANVIETIKVNNTALTPTNKAVNITVPTVGNGTITIKQAGTTKGTFTTNQSGNTTIELADNNTWRDVVDNLTSTDATKSLSANQGKVLKGLVDGKAAASHSHNYAGSSSAGGDATNALKLSGLSASAAATASTIVARDSNNYVSFSYIHSNTSNNENPPISQIIVTNGSDNFYRKASLAHLKSSLGSMPASDVYSWAKASTKPTYTASEVGAAAASHTHNYAGSSSAGGAATTALTCTGNSATSSKLTSSSYATISIATSDWATNSSGGYVCTKSLSSAMAYTNFNIDVVLSTDQSAAKLQIESWNNVIADGEITQTTSNGSTTAFTFYAFTTKPSVALTVGIQGVS